MELKLQSPFLALVLTFLIGLLPGILFAQESELVPREYHPTETHTSATSNESSEEEELVIEEEKTTSRTSSNNFVSKDSVAAKPPVVSNKSKTKTVNESQKSLTDQKSTDKNSEDEEDVLSLNFLYYIFEKFKLSDIVDK